MHELLLLSIAACDWSSLPYTRKHRQKSETLTESLIGQLSPGGWRGTLALEENSSLLQLKVSTSDMNATRPASQRWGCLFIYLFICLFIYLSIYLLVYYFIYLFINLFFIYLSDQHQVPTLYKVHSTLSTNLLFPNMYSIVRVDCIYICVCMCVFIYIYIL